MTVRLDVGVAVAGAAREFHVSRQARARYRFDDSVLSLRGTLLVADYPAAQRLAAVMNEVREVHRFPELAVRPGELFAAAVIDEALHLLLAAYRQTIAPSVLREAMERLREALGDEAFGRVLRTFVATFPPQPVARGEVDVDGYLAGSEGGVSNAEVVLEELLMLWLSNENPALERFLDLFDDRELERETAYPSVIELLGRELRDAPGMAGAPSLLDLLQAPVRASPTSLRGQLAYIRDHWEPLLGERFQALVARLLRSLDVLAEEQVRVVGPPGPAPVLSAEALRGPSRGRVEYERFSPDSSWMPRVVLLAKSTYVWLDQLSRRYRQDIHRLDQIPDEVLDELADFGFSGLWLIGLWQRSEASRKIKHLRGQHDAVASAYALYDYRIADDLGGHAAYESLRDRAWQRGLRLASDMVPNHFGIDGRWVIEHPDRFLQLDHPPFPSYTFDGPDLSSDPRVGIFIEDHYYDGSDAAVVFKRLDRRSGEARYIYHGNDGTSMPWNDTAQLNYLNPETREAVIRTILEVARMFPIIRFDAAMTLAKQHIQRLWFPEPGHGGAIPSRAQYGSMTAEEFDRVMPNEFWREVVDRVAAEVPDTLLLAEAFWMMEGYFVRTLGMHRVYNSAFMNMFKREANQEYRQLMKNVLEFDPQILKRFVNFMNNPDEETAVAQFGKDDKYFGTCLVMCTMPGLPMFGHGQIEGFSEKYGMEFRRPRLAEEPDQALVARHRREIRPLLHRREEFADVEHFRLYDFEADGYVNEDVYAYSNRAAGTASLVVFHNRFAEARGWIRRSVAFRRGAGSSLERSTLAEGLGLSGGERFVIFREHPSGLEHLRRSRDLVEQGLYLELGAFRYHAFLDFREVDDTDETPYAALYESLAGRPVASVEAALTDLRYRSLHEAFTALLELADDVVAASSAESSPAAPKEESAQGESSQSKASNARAKASRRSGAGRRDEKAQRAELSRRFADFLAAADEAGVAAPQPRARRIMAEAYRRLQRLDFGARPQLDPLAFPHALARLLLAAEALRLVGVAPADAQRVRLPAAAARSWSERAGNEAAWLTAEGGELLLQLLLEHLDDVLALAPDARAVLEQLLDDPAVRAFIGVHHHGGVDWYRQEPFELLASALVAAALVAAPVRVAGRLRKLAQELAAAEAASGFRLERLRDPEGLGAAALINDVGAGESEPLDS